MAVCLVESEEKIEEQEVGRGSRDDLCIHWSEICIEHSSDLVASDLIWATDLCSYIPNAPH